MTTGTLIALAIGGALMMTATPAGAAIVDVVARGRRLTVSTLKSGRVQESTDALVSQASDVAGYDVSDDAYALARMCRSEQGSSGQITKVALCHVACNQADALGMSPAGLVRYHRGGSYFGEQSGGRVSSAQDPYEDDLTAAETALSQRAAGQDSTGGATNFVNVNAFGVQSGAGSFEAWDSEMASEGKVGGTLPGTADGLVFYWRGSVPDFAESLS